ncbi:MAG: Uma2 family endonuclease [Chloroflexi bacterium]|nr:Uma2 family endonuclease [Chloroflexota bacterium]
MALVKRTRKQSALAQAIAEFYPRPGEWTEEDYLTFSDTSRIVELSDGTVEVPEMPTDPHQLAVNRLLFFLMLYLDTHKRGRVRTAPLPVRLWPGKFREPDLVFMLNEHADRIEVEYWGVPDLAVEVHSPGTRRTDRTKKKKEYAQAGITEYWMADYKAETIEVCRLAGDAYELRAKFGAEDTLTSEMLPGFELKIAEVFAEE